MQTITLKGLRKSQRLSILSFALKRKQAPKAPTAMVSKL